jgi:hypothetical protein
MTDDSYCKTKETALPSWMNEPEEVLPVPDRQGGRTHFLRRTMLELGSALEQELHNENMSRRDGFLQRIDARLKIAAVLMAVLLTALVHDIRILLVLYGLNVLLMMVSRLPAWTLQKRIWLTIPLLTLLLALPATLNLFNDGTPLLVICTLPGQFRKLAGTEQLFISYQGATVSPVHFSEGGVVIVLGGTANSYYSL